MYGGSNGGSWARSSPGYGGPPPSAMSRSNDSTGGSALHRGPYTGPPPPSAPPGQHFHYSPSPGPSSAHAGSPAPLHPPPPTGPASSSYQQPIHGNAQAPPGFVPAARPPPPGGYAGPPPSSQYGDPPGGPASIMTPHGQYNGPPPGMGPGYGGPGQFHGPTAALPIGGVPAHTTIFVGTISGGVSDYWLKRLFDACGSLKSFKRVNASFGFAEFIDADSVLRALAVLPGMELPSMGKERDHAAARKKLTVKADEKTRKYLNQYEQGRMHTQIDEQAQDSARRAVRSICEEMLDPNHIEEEAATTSTSSIPQHLKDLPPEELPEEHRGAVLSEIEKFRQASAARDEERKRKERIQEMDRLRASEREQRQPQQGRGGDEAYSSSGPLQSNGLRSDPQSYSRPVSFVPGSTGRDETMLAPDEQYERDEQRRKQRERDEAMRSGQEAERQYQSKERTRLAHWDRELGIEEAELERRRRKAASQRRLYEEWDQTRESERDLFYLDRTRWRGQRRQQRQREEREDEADRVAQAEEEERARIETERFLAQQAEDMAIFEREQRAAGVLMPGASGEHAPLRLKRVVAADGSDITVPGQAPAQAQSQAQSTQAPAQQPKGILGTLDDDNDLSGIRRGKLGHIDLTDTSDVNVMRERVRRDLPAQREELFDRTPKWEQLAEASLDTRYRETIDKGLIASLGESVPDMVDEILAKVRAHASASDLIEVVEPVLEDEAAPLIATLWTEILVDTLAGLPPKQDET